MNWALGLVWLGVVVAGTKQRCEPITIPLCKGIGYNMTSYPNSYGHEKQDEAGLEVHQFFPLVEVNCYKHLKFFLCALYTPICQENLDMSIMPCQEVCREAQKKCSPIMNSHGFRWPETLNCDRLPKFSEQESTGKICAAPPDATHSSAEITGTPQQSNPVKPHSVQQPERCSCQCGRPFNPVSAESVTHPYQSYQVLNVSNCAYSCSGLLPNPSSQRIQQHRSWIMFISMTGFCLSLFTMITFALDMERFPYPERPIFFLALCQMCVAIGFMVQFWTDVKVGCDVDMLRTMMKPLAMVGNSLNFGCMGVFMLVYYFGMAAAVWWVVLALSWVLAAVPHWSTEWIGKYSCYFHSCAWLLPAFQTVMVYWVGGVDGDPVSGICYVGNTNLQHLLYFVIAPLIVYFLAGVTFLFVGFHYLWDLRSNLKKAHHKTSKLTQLLSKIGVFAVLYSGSVVLHVMVLLYEYIHRPLWEQSLLCPCATEMPVTEDTLYLLNLLKTGSMMAVGWSLMVWVFSPKTLQSWHRLFCCTASPYATYSGPKLPFGPELHVSQYQQIPPPALPPVPHPQYPPPPHRKYPDMIYAQQDHLSPHFAGNTLRHCMPREL